jgi:signal peptidase I
MRCPSCGEENKPDRPFCAVCAAELIRGAAAEIQPPRAAQSNARRMKRAKGALRSAWSHSTETITQVTPSREQVFPPLKQALFALLALAPGLAHLLRGMQRTGIRLMAGFAAAFLVNQLLIGSVVGDLAGLACYGIMGASFLDFVRLDVRTKQRNPIAPSQIFLTLAAVLGMMALIPAVLGLVWARATLTQPIVQLAPPGDGEVPQVIFDINDQLLFNRHAYSRAQPERGDIVLATVDDTLSVQRILAVPGDTLTQEEGQLFLNGAPLPAAAYPLQPPTPVEPVGTRLAFPAWSQKIPKGQYAVWGIAHLQEYNARADAAANVSPALISKSDIVGKGWLVNSPFYHRRLIDHLSSLPESRR